MLLWRTPKDCEKWPTLRGPLSKRAYSEERKREIEHMHLGGRYIETDLNDECECTIEQMCLGGRSADDEASPLAHSFSLYIGKVGRLIGVIPPAQRPAQPAQ